MAKNKVNFRDLIDGELEQRSRELGEELFNLRFQVSMSMAKNPARIGKVRRDIARIKTILRERALGLKRG
jgi:large subunit ribosomal protein L29